MELHKVADFPDFVKQHWDKVKFKNLTEIQEKAVPLLVQGHDLLLESPTGTGKTLAYLLPIFKKIDVHVKKTQAIVIAPTRELVMQIQQVAQDWLAGTEASSAAFIGGADIKRQVEKLKKHPQIVIGTPTRLQELISMKKLKMHEVKTIVLDEADQLFVLDMKPVIEDIIRTTLADRQLVIVSATITERTEQSAMPLMRDPQVIRIARKSGAESKVEHIYYVSHPKDKIDQLRQYVKNHEVRALVFINGTAYIPEVAKRLKSRGIQSGILSGEGTKTEREATILQFRKGQFPLLLTTDLAARGLDIEGLTHVIHFDLPEDVTQYIHRSGRTGRQGAEGTVVSFITPRDEKKLQHFGHQLNLKIEQRENDKIQEKRSFSNNRPKNSQGTKVKDQRGGSSKNRRSSQTTNREKS